MKMPKEVVIDPNNPPFQAPCEDPFADSDPNWKPTPRPNYGQRSEPGKGKKVTIYLAGESKYDLDGVPAIAQFKREGEDYSITEWPICIKVKPEVTRTEAAQMIRDLADRIEADAQIDGDEYQLDIDTESDSKSTI